MYYNAKSGLILLILQSLLYIVFAGKEYQTNEISCGSCFTYFTSCIDYSFKYGACCEYSELNEMEDLERCRNKYMYCTTNLTKTYYRRLTCPQSNCPAGEEIYNHTEYGKTKYISRNWGWFDHGFNCKIKLVASPDLNGKLIMNIQTVDDT